MTHFPLLIWKCTGADENEYRVFSAKDRSVQGVYMCLVSNNTGQCLTKGAVLQISETLTHKQDYFGKESVVCSGIGH